MDDVVINAVKSLESYVEVILDDIVMRVHLTGYVCVNGGMQSL